MPNTAHRNTAHNKVVRVAAGVIVDAQNRVLVSKRQQGQHLAGLWEFPGGKVELGETLEAALKRELQEELGIVISRAEPLQIVKFDYAEKSVELNFYLVVEFSGTPSGLEGQCVRWVPAIELSELEFPAANAQVLPNLYKRLGY